MSKLHERRRDPRHTVMVPCKLYDPRSRKYTRALTCNISAGGIMIDLPYDRDLKPGDRIMVGVPSSPGEAVIAQADMRAGTVRSRLCAVGLDTVLGIEFDERLAEPVESTLRLAA
ncbi:MAG: PilZ domain-containing protein [Phycisphaerales bacterium]|nr:PilZ domain-containing protein [Phycisphaerales bacterium]